MTQCQALTIEGEPQHKPEPKSLVEEKAIQTSQLPQKFGEISINGHLKLGEERKLVHPQLSWKNTLTDPFIIEPKIVEIIKEVPVEVIKEVVKEPDMVPVERISQGTNTEPKSRPQYTINSFSEFQREAPKPPVKILVTTEAQTFFTPPKLVMQDRTSEFHLKPKSAAPSPLKPTDKVFSFNYEGSAKSSQGGSNQTSPSMDKLQRRLKIYEDQNVKLQLEIDALKNKQTGLYSKLSEKTFESSGNFQTQIDQLKKDNTQLRSLLEKSRNEATKIKEQTEKEVKSRYVVDIDEGSVAYRLQKSKKRGDGHRL